MTKTTTSRIEKLENGIIVNSYFTSSCIKEPYLYEQSIELSPLMELDSKGLLLDCSRVHLSMEEIHRVATSPYFSSANYVAVLLPSKFQQLALKLWTKLQDQSDKVSFFIRKENAFLWLEERYNPNSLSA